MFSSLRGIVLYGLVVFETRRLRMPAFIIARDSGVVRLRGALPGFLFSEGCTDRGNSNLAKGEAKGPSLSNAYCSSLTCPSLCDAGILSEVSSAGV
ncbi:hypothetical protein F2Q69_00018195 [Brassica cretica]|uniref:Uncharacterized protein n=1 Tax=Brassica cretica TaxID=69181 RepID=A0A8S9Q2Q5_BRACR|nr:hypothetical protein F2Q69_00018195 [Brassica cretica]